MGERGAADALRYLMFPVVSDGKDMEKVATSRPCHVVLLGAYPPPIGGNSVHVQRLHERLRADRFRSTVIDMYGHEGQQGIIPDVIRVGGRAPGVIARLCATVRRCAPDIVHVHVSAMRRFIYVWPLLMLLLPVRARKLLSVHSGTFVRDFDGAGPVRKLALLYCLRCFAGIIVMNVDQKRFLMLQGLDEAKISVIPAFLPARSSVPDVVPIAHAKVAQKSTATVVVSSGYGIALYGYEYIVEAVNRLRAAGIDCCLWICIYNTIDETYIESLVQQASDSQALKVFRNLNADQFSHVLERGDIYVRGTDRDGDCVAVREAAALGLNVIATNVVPRPDYCTLFPFGDVDSLEAGLRACMVAGKPGASQELHDGFPSIRRLYERVLC